MRTPSRIVLTNGRIYTLDTNFRFAHTVAIEGNRISKVINGSEFKRDSKSQILDLKGKTVIPAFCDSHVHLLLLALSLNQIDLNKAKSLKQVLSLIKDKTKKSKPNEWISGRGWNINQWSTKKFPDKKSLDKISPCNPIALSSKDEHLLWVNSFALKLASINETTSDPIGGEIERYPNSNEPTGILKEEAMRLVRRILNKPNSEEFRKMFCEAVQNAYKFGITSVHNFDGGATNHLFEEMLSKEGKLPLRILEFFKDEKLEEFINSNIPIETKNEYLRIGGIKLFADGALGSRTALMFEPYENTKNNLGIEVTDSDKLKSMVSKANILGLNVAIHAIGDKGVHNALDAIEHSIRENKKYYANRIEHAQLVKPSDLKRFKNLKVTASVQPIHATSDRDMAIKHWGKRCVNAYRLKSFLNNGIRVIFGSDCPIEDLNPLKGIYAAVTRKREKVNESPFYPKERINIREAILGFTKWPAIASGEEKQKGSIQTGKLADMIVLSENIFKVPSREIPNIKVLVTIFDGKIVYGKKNL
ncbi:MAG: amidohydrolase [candidate division Zixibacteria bacterium]|nr:amidohydrolase [candidate division Zixibacteria bacterium]